MPPLKNDVNQYRNNPILIYIIQQNSDLTDTNSKLSTLLNWNLLATYIKKNGKFTIDTTKYKDLLLSFGVSTTPYATDSVFIPVSDITRGFYNQACSHTIYYDGSKARIDFKITGSGVLTVTDIVTTVSTWDPCITRVNVR